MTHADLITLLKNYAENAAFRMDRNSWLILNDVVELHKPEGLSTDPKCYECQGLDAVDWPCATIQAIEKELE